MQTRAEKLRGVSTTWLTGGSDATNHVSVRLKALNSYVCPYASAPLLIGLSLPLPPSAASGW